MIRLTDREVLVTTAGISRVLAVKTRDMRRAALNAELSMRELRHQLVRVGRAAQRAAYSPGDRHVDRIARECAVRRLDAGSTTVRLIAADVVAEVLDQRQEGTA